MNKVIEIEKLSFAYNGTSVLNDINLTVEEKDFIGIVGPNGGGKTTLLKLILGFLQPGKGRVKLFGKSPGASRKLIGYVPQYLEFDKQFPITVEQVVDMGLCRPGFLSTFRRTEKELIIKTLVKLGIDGLAKKQFGELSGGQKQRTLIARAIISEPKILILDEPTASVDATAELDIYEMLKNLNKEITILLVSHDISFISSYVNKVACVNRNIAVHSLDALNADQIINEVYKNNVTMIHHKCGL
jgi:zinc transport system ATP-binding protein